jgi:hypothetical protein
MRPEMRLVSLGAICFTLFLIVLFPARAAFGLFLPEGVSAFGVSGTLWAGSAKIITVSGQQLRNTEWDLALPRLLLGQLAGDFQTRWSGGFLEGSGSVSMLGNLTLSESRANFDAAILKSALNTPEIGGQVSLQITELQAAGFEEWPAVLIATAEIRNLSSPLMGRGEAGQIGSVAIVFDTSAETDENLIYGVIEDIGGPLEAKGNLLLTKPVSYALKVRVKARDGASAGLKQNLEFLGAAEADGARVFQLAGSI